MNNIYLLWFKDKFYSTSKKKLLKENEPYPKPTQVNKFSKLRRLREF